MAILYYSGMANINWRSLCREGQCLTGPLGHRIKNCAGAFGESIPFCNRLQKLLIPLKIIFYTIFLQSKPLQNQFISGSSTAAPKSVRKKSKSHPLSACSICCWYICPYPLSNLGFGGIQAFRLASNSASSRSIVR